MRMLDTTHFVFKEFSGLPTEPYAILSHCWNHQLGSEEITYQQVLAKSYDYDSPGWQKVLTACRIARSRGWRLLWMDTCCLDKTSSAELSETINSMYKFYERSDECHVLLDDVPAAEYPFVDQRFQRSRMPTDDYQDLCRSRWFTRGWTLQELLAPRKVVFFNKMGDVIGDKSEVASVLSPVTGIQMQFLTMEASVQTASVAQRMSWAAPRRTTRLEDRAYSLLGIFGVNMPLLYGEGENAFLRLQLAIIGQCDDESIYA